MKILIHVGSKSDHKLAAVRGACEDLCLSAEVVGFTCPSNVNEQPDGLAETRRGAVNRADGAWHYGPRTPDIAIGIESGIIDDGDGVHFDFAVVVVRAPFCQRFHAIAGGTEIYREDVLVAAARGFDEHTAGSVTAERTGCDKTDATPHYTGGRVHRAELLRQAVKVAIAEWLTFRPSAQGSS